MAKKERSAEERVLQGKRQKRKRIHQNETSRLRNKSVKGRLRSHAKQLRAAIADKKFEEAEKLLTKSQTLYDQAAAKGCIHRNTAARFKSRLARVLNQAKVSA